MRILWMSDSPTAFTGYGRVTREIVGRLARRGHDVAAVGWGYTGWPYDRAAIPYTIYPSDARLFGRDAAPRAIEEFRPDVFVILGDFWMYEWIRELRVQHPYKLILYFPVDGIPFPNVYAPLLRKADAAVAYSRFGQREALAACPDVDVTMIYHGVDTDIFRPLGPKREYQESQQLGGRFVVGCVARNQPRKLFPLLVKAFARFSGDHDEALLYLHTDPADVGWDLAELARAYGIAERTAFSFQANVNNGIDTAGLNEIYNMMDVMVLPTMGEGFGLPILEAMAAGVPVVATRCSACEELVEGRGELIEVKAVIPVGRNCVEHALPDTDDLLAKLKLLWSEPERRERHQRAGLEFAQMLRWENLLPQWEELLTRFE